MTRAKLLALLRKHDACKAAVAWLEDSEHQTLAEAWNACERADWMLWLLARMYPDAPGPFRLACCACAETALRFVPKGEDRPRIAIETARRYARGLATPAELAAAWAAAWAAAELAAAWDAAELAAAWAAARDAAWAAAAGDAAWAASLKDMAGIVRSLIPDPEHLPRVEDMPDRREAKP
jgi:hypothetical protein